MLAEQTRTTDETELQDADEPITIDEFAQFVREAINQPPWRANADKEADYADGNQLDSDLLKKQAQLGIPPAKENIIGPAIRAVCGYEAKTRTDWRVTPDGDPGGQDVADALNYRLNQAERHSHADRALSDAFRPAATVGIGWVEVARESDPFKFPYRCAGIHRNEIYFDHLSQRLDMGDARYLLRRRWTDVAQAKLKFPEHAHLLEMTMGRWTDRAELSMDGSSSTGLAMNFLDERGWSIEEQQWRDTEHQRVCLYEMWYRRWEQVTVLKAPGANGKVVEYDPSNPAHDELLAAGAVKPMKATMPRMYVSYWAGPHKLHDGPTPYTHHEFPYVPFWAAREDRTGVPFGRVRGMVYLQDNVNSATSKIRWGLGASRVERTKGAVAMSDAQFRQTVGRVDADVILDATHMAQQGATFKVHRDFELNEQQYKMLQDSRLGIERASGISAGFMGQRGSATSGLQEQTQIEQATQTLAALMDNFKQARSKVGELLLSLIIEDMQDEETVVIPGNAIKQERTVVVNKPTIDPVTGVEYRTNDVQRIRLKVALDDVPSSSSFRAQQLNAMSEAFKAMPQNLQVVAMPHLLSLMDLPDKDEIIKAVRDAGAQETPEQIDKRIAEAVKQALANAAVELKGRELDLKYSPEKMRADIAKIVSETVESGVRSSFSAMQAAQTVAQLPMVAPIADVLLQNAGWQAPTPKGMDPNIPQPSVAMPEQPAMAVPGDTSPQTPANPMSPAQGVNQGINTMREDSTTDNLQGAPA